MKSFREFITERLKSEHEPNLRHASSRERLSYYGDGTGREKSKRYGKMSGRSQFSQSSIPTRFAHFGDCEDVSNRIAGALKKEFPSATVVNGTKDKIPHSWVHIPEIDHFIDPTHDQFKSYHKKYKYRRKNQMATVNNLFPDNAIKIGKISDYDKHGYSVDMKKD